MQLDVKVVVNCSNAADDFLVVTSKEELNCRVRVKGMTRRVYELVDVATERRNPVWVVAIKPERKLYKVTPISLRPDRIDANISTGYAQIKSISRPTRLNASRTKSS